MNVNARCYLMAKAKEMLPNSLIAVLAVLLF